VAGPVFADLHMHTTASDGELSPSRLVAEATAAGLRAIAICDHDTVAGIREAAPFSGNRVEIVTGIEMSANVGNDEVHVLGLFVNIEDHELLQRLSWLQQQRLARVRRFCDRLSELGLPIEFADVEREASGESIGRPHIARAMIRRGYVQSVNDAFDKYLASGRPAFVPRTDITPEDCIATIHAAGGVASLAHPFTIVDPEAMLGRLRPVGLDAVESEYGAYSEDQRSELRSLATRFDLLRTGGSDYHGPTHRESNPPGSGGVSQSELESIRHRANRNRANRP
jgi:predicted metal-dependent phosphoesterase TrpH